MTIRRIGMYIACALSIAATGSQALAQDSDVSKMMAEVSQLSAEQSQIPAKLQQSLALKQQHERQFQQLNQESNSLKSEGSSIDAQRPTVTSLCTGKVPHAQFAAAQARCQAVLVPFNRRVDAYNAHKGRLSTAYQAINQQENARAAEARRLQARGQQLSQRIAVLQASIRAKQVAAKPASCTQSCAGKSGEAAAQCLQHCFDGARKDTDLPTVEQKYVPPSGATANRTPEQAIEEYKRSGDANPMPKSFRRNAAEPPPPSPSH